MSTNSELPIERIEQLYARFVEQAPHAEWEESYFTEVEWVQALSPPALDDEESQKRLWRLRDIASIGSGEAVAVRGAYDDPAVIQAMRDLKALVLPSNPEERAGLLQLWYDQVIALVYPKHSPLRPLAKLARIFTGLFPRDMTTLFNRTAAGIVGALLLGDRPCQPVERMVLIRYRLRTILGEEAGLREDVRRSTFCWWLYEHEQEIREGRDPEGEDKPPTSEPATSTTLSPLPVGRQRRGLSAIRGYLETWRAVVAASRNGASPEDIVDTLRTSYGLHRLSPKSCRMLFNDVRNNGFLVSREGLWYPAEDGVRLIEDDPPDVLVERLLVQYYGLAQVLRFLRAGPRTRSGIVHELKRRYPSWTSDFGPSAQLAWAWALGLIAENAEGDLALSDYGAVWEARLPLVLPDPALGAEAEIEDPPARSSMDEATVLPSGIAAPPFEDVDRRLGELHAEFVYDKTQVRCIHAAWHCNPRKRFVLLSGLSGTGKTALLRQYAHAYVALTGGDAREQICVVSVSPDWRDPSSLLGYFNPLHSEPSWQKEPALALLLHACRFHDRPHFLVLDEMNLAQVEHYFAPFLSAMESGEPLRLHQEDDDVNEVPPRVAWPPNLFIGGTLNMDETTHAVSDKVLDRAFTFEFWDVDLETFFRNRPHPVRDDVRALLLAIQATLRGVRRHFGYRAAGEVLAFTHQVGEPVDMLDYAVLSKILPRLRGENSSAFRAALQSVREICHGAQLSRCVAKLDDMRARLDLHGAAQFWA